MNPHPQPTYGDAGPSSYQSASSYDGSMSSYIVSPEMNPHMTLIASAPHNQTPIGSNMQMAEVVQQPYQHVQPSNGGHHPHQQQNQGMHRQTFAGVNYVNVPRHSSSQPTRSESPHMLGADVFGGPMAGGMNDSGLMLDGRQSHLPAGYEFAVSEYSSEVPIGISPARALGPAPVPLPPMATPASSDSHTTPTNNAAAYRPMLSSSSAGSSSGNSSSVERPTRNGKLPDTSDDENDSPTKRVHDRIPTFDMPTAESSRGAVSKRPPPLAGRPKSGSGTSRSSSKLGKVAEDPGVEGIPPGPRSMERPSQSFACIIGQAILKSSAGGLSLEHIYRYVETAYPYFKGIDQWRNSVRHNLSIHKIFLPIQRTEKHPPGKGGIWIIDEDEKIHWPSEDKFIKNFPPSHPHHAKCRQTLHEQEQERKQREKAAAEGRPYIPKRGKRTKLAKHAEETKKADALMPPPVTAGPSAHHTGMQQPQQPHAQTHMGTAMPVLPSQPLPGPLRMMPPPPPSSPPQSTTHPSSFDFEDDSDFVPMPSASKREEPLRPLRFNEIPRDKRPALAPPPPMASRFSLAGQENKPIHDDDEENVFGSGPKRVRLTQPEPLSPAMEQQADTSAFLDADMFMTPLRERPTQGAPATSEGSRQLTSSALKTPALVQTSSSPTSSPMPPTVTRSSHHHPSSLQQAWTQDDMICSATPASPAKLEAAFDLKPAPVKREREEDGFHSLVPHTSERAPPKTPVTRSSAAANRTPRIGGVRTPMMHKTPLSYGSPQVPGTANSLLSTPMWEMSGVLDRMRHPDSPTACAHRSDVPPTSPTHYSLSDCGDSPIAKRRKVMT